ncbi:hypothetical protein [Bradyrhizobium yuanmingense]|uniref:hypothetical protein n=1 Tax=Bradyrhizobium yuanmingense TaxID=108015 RepID=UPI0013157B0F|nr:hypothetical protein [Bradyrhizobium yuanmingense]
MEQTAASKIPSVLAGFARFGALWRAFDGRHRPRSGSILQPGDNQKKSRAKMISGCIS